MDALFIYALAWLLFAVLHSVLARRNIQRYVERHVGRYYRLLYNVFALACMAIVLELGRQLLDHSRYGLFATPALMGVSMAIQLLGLVVLVLALTQYDIGRFSGLTQIVKGEILSVAPVEPFCRGGLNRWMRHPLYTGVFILLWGGAVSSFACWTALWASVYLVVGSYYEERKLNRLYGSAYSQYQKEVPRFFPTIMSK